MAEGSSRGSRKRSFVEDDDSGNPPAEKRVRFPKGKKLKQGDYVKDLFGEDTLPSWKDPRFAASDRANRRHKFVAELISDVNSNSADISKAEVQYEENENFDEEGITIEPFNLDKEREEGYFDENGNYVEYISKNEIKDAWLDSVDVAEKYAGKSTIPAGGDDKPHDLTTEELAIINRRIADVLEPGETVLRALRRLKGNSSDKKQKMSPETKHLFDQLTDDAMKLMENGDYDVYDERQESFMREADGYERLIETRKQFFSQSSVQDKSGDSFEIFGDGGNAAENPASNCSVSTSVQPSESAEQQNDYAYDESSGYYYSSSSGYYYDPSSGLYCCAASGKWYSYNENSGTYDEIEQDANAEGLS